MDKEIWLLTVRAMRATWNWLLEHHRLLAGARARRELHELSDRMLKDIGVKRSDIGVKRSEIDRLFR